MFYEPDKNNHGLPRNPYKSIVIPRPIGWVSTLSKEGKVNLAPYSQFNNLGYDPPYVMFSASARDESAQMKDSVRNAIDTGEFVCNMATYDLRDAVNTTSQPHPPGVDEFEIAGLAKEPSQLVKPPRVAASPIHLECQYYSCVLLPGNAPMNTTHVVIGKVIGVHIRDEVIGADGKLDVLKYKPLARLGYLDYTAVERVFTLEMTGPQAEKMRAGMGGEAKGVRQGRRAVG